MAQTTAASLTLAQARLLLASLMQDESATNPFLPATTATSTQPRTKNDLLKDWFNLWCEKFDNRLLRMNGAATFGAIAASAKTLVSVDATVAEWRHCHIEDDNAKICVGAELGIIAPNRVRMLQQQYPTTGVPSHIGFDRDRATVSGTVGLWRAHIWPLPTASTLFVSAVVRTTPYFPGADGEMFDCDPASARQFVRMAAIEGSFLAGRDPDYIQNLMGPLGAQEQAIVRSEMATWVRAGQLSAGAEAQ